MTRITDSLHDDQYPFLVISRSVLLRMRNVSDKICRGNKNTHFMFNNFLFENRAAYEIMCKNIVERGRPRITIWRIRIACWTAKARDIHSEYVKLLHFLCNSGCTKAPYSYVFTYTVCLVYSNVIQQLFRLTHSFMFFWFHFFYDCIYGCMFLFSFVNNVFLLLFTYFCCYVYVFLLLCMFYSVYSFLLCCSVYCL